MKTFRFLHAPVVDSSVAMRHMLRSSDARLAVIGGSSRLGWRWRRTAGRSYAAVAGRRGTASLERGCQKIDIKPDLFAAYDVTIVDGIPVATIAIDSMADFGVVAADQVIDLVADLRERHEGIEFIFGCLIYSETPLLVREMFDHLHCSWLNEGEAWVAVTDGLTIADWVISRTDFFEQRFPSFVEVDIARVG